MKATLIGCRILLLFFLSKSLLEIEFFFPFFFTNKWEEVEGDMEKFEIFKLKEAGLSNEQVLRVLDYCRKHKSYQAYEEIWSLAVAVSFIL